MTWNEAKTRECIRDRSQGRCELCGQREAIHAHHRLNRSQGGLWTPSNLLHVDWKCHHKITVNPLWAISEGLTVEHALDPQTVPVRLRHPVLLAWWFLITDEPSIDFFADYATEPAALAGVASQT